MFTKPLLGWQNYTKILYAKQQRTKWNHQKKICLTFQWLCLILYLYKQFLRLGQNLPLSYSLLYMVRPYTVWKKYVYNFQSGSI